MPDGDHERMSGADRVGIAKCECETITRQYALRRQCAEGASGAAVHPARVQVRLERRTRRSQFAGTHRQVSVRIRLFAVDRLSAVVGALP